MNEITQDEWLRRAYELAYFIHGDKEIARAIAANAMSKLDVAAVAQFKRFYYTPQGRESARASRSKVSLNDLQLLQRLVYVESEPFEKQKENEKNVCNNDLLVHFIKHLVRITLKRNSFYVALGLSRILHAYGTNETMEIYNTVIQDPERVHDDYYYRSRKGQLMKEIKSRFGDLLKLSRGARGEERFQAKEPSEDKAATVKDCLERFTPWATKCVVPDHFDPYSDAIEKFSFEGKDPDAEHRVEINRIHATLHPNCYCKIIKALGFEEPNKRLEIPEFQMNDENNTPNDRHKPPTLSDNELQAIKELLAAQSANRHAASCGLLRVLVDGDERARLNPHEAESVEFDLGDDAELVEVRVVEKNGDVLLATHLLSFDDTEENQAAILLEGGQKISFQFRPTKDEHGEITGAHFGVVYEETNLLRRTALSWRRFLFTLSAWSNANAFWKPALAFGLLLIVCGAGFWLYLQRQKSVDGEVTKNISIPMPTVDVPTPQPTQKQSPETIANSNKETKPPVQQKKQTTNAPQQQEVANSNTPKRTTPDYEQVAIARIPVRGDTSIDPNKVRGEHKASDLKMNQIRKVFVQISGGDALSKQIQNDITKSLSASGRFTVVQSREQADGSLKISVKQSASDKTKAQVTVSLVNPVGRYVWTNRKNVRGWKYIGAAEKLPSRIIGDLVKESGQK